jgi:LysM repeat protein
MRIKSIKRKLAGILALSLSLAMIGGAANAATASRASTVYSDASSAVSMPAAAAPHQEVVHVVRIHGRYYTVQNGDYLSLIAQRHCSNAYDWTGIYRANHRIIGPNPDVINPGQNLKIACYTVRITLPAYRRTDGDGDYDHDRSDHVSVSSSSSSSGSGSGGSVSGSGFYDPSNTVLSEYQIERVWVAAGGPAWAEYQAYLITGCESGRNRFAYNPSGATGLWQILGAVYAGNLDDAWINAKNAVMKFEASGDTWAQWVCRP